MVDDPNLEWLGHVQPVGLVVAPRVLSERGLLPAEQTRADTEEAQTIVPEDGTPADPWAMATTLLGWQPALVAGATGGPELPDDLSAWVPEAETRLAPNWAVQKPGGGWQLLVQILAAGTDPDGRNALAGWEATPHQRLERLLRETDIPIGLLIGGDAWRLVYAPRGETSGWLRFPLAPLRLVAGRPMLGALKLLLGRSRLFTDGEVRRLPALLRESREAQAAVSAKLASQVVGALHDLLRGFNAADPERMAALAHTRPEHVYEGLLSVLLRLVFLLYAEDRDLIPSRNDAAARGLYARGYGVRGLHARLLDDASKNPDTMNERTGAWGRLLALFRLVHTGDGSGWIRGRGGALFDPAKFPFLQGQDTPDASIAIPRLADETVLRVLDRLLVLDGERLSYRTLDVEQIGSVYETVMGFTVIPAPGPSLAIAAGKSNRTPVFVDLKAMAMLRAKDRLRALKEEYSRAQLSAKQAAAIEVARDETALAEALRPLVDERGSPGATITAAGTPLLQPTDERRRSGSHYTPRSLTEPIVRHALEPAFERIGSNALPEKVLALKVCDPAMGSGAFLVEACRQLATRLVAAWVGHPATRPAIPPDADEDLLARRLIAQRCLYGVDRNPLAVDLARLSLWLVTLARDHEFTFLDHALKSGDSLVGLTTRQIGRLAWRDDQADLAPFDGLLRERVVEAVQARGEIQDAPDDIERAVQEKRHQHIEARLNDVQRIGDAVLGAFFSADKPRQREIARLELGVWTSGTPQTYWPKIAERATTLQMQRYPVNAFHWGIEFPEVFHRENPGFDVIVGNPPFMRGKAIGVTLGDPYRDYLTTTTPGSNASADIVAFFFRRAFDMLRDGGTVGFIATKTISKGDTRYAGLRYICIHGGTIYTARRRLRWPGTAAVVVSALHIIRGTHDAPELDGERVSTITAFLFSHGGNEDPTPLSANAGYSFNGCALAGVGFTFDDDEPRATPISQYQDLIAADPRNAARISPYLGGDEINNSPTHEHRRFTIFFRGMSLDAANNWPMLMDIVRRKVKPERDKANRAAHRERWWQFGDWRPGLFSAISSLDRMLCVVFVSQHLGFVWLPTDRIVSHNVGVFAADQDQFFCVLQSRVHEVFATQLSSGLEDRQGYRPSDGFEPFPFPIGYREDVTLATLGERYYDFRAAVMVHNNEGLTKTYNRFHDPDEDDTDIVHLRQLHEALDRAVLDAYGWHDIPTNCEFVLDYEVDDEEVANKKKPLRYRWPDEVRDEVLARLLKLNSERAAEERLHGRLPLSKSN